MMNPTDIFLWALDFTGIDMTVTIIITSFLSFIHAQEVIFSTSKPQIKNIQVTTSCTYELLTLHILMNCDSLFNQ